MGPLNQDSRNRTGVPSCTTLSLVKSFVLNSWHRPTGPSRKLLGQVCPRIPQCGFQEGDVARHCTLHEHPSRSGGTHCYFCSKGQVDSYQAWQTQHTLKPVLVILPSQEFTKNLWAFKILGFWNCRWGIRNTCSVPHRMCTLPPQPNKQN